MVSVTSVFKEAADQVSNTEFAEGTEIRPGNNFGYTGFPSAFSVFSVTSVLKTAADQVFNTEFAEGTEHRSFTIRVTPSTSLRT